jgi:hypothetical protein
MKRLHLFLTSAMLAAAAGAVRLEGTVLIPAELHELVAEARTIVHGRVVATEPRPAEGERGIETLVTIAAADYLKGSLGARVTVRVPGGQIGDRRHVVIGAPVLRPGDDVVLFLGGSGPSVPWIVGLNQGAFRVRSTSGPVQRQERQERFGGELRVVEPFTTVVRGMSSGGGGGVPLETFKARVRRLAREGGAR